MNSVGNTATALTQVLPPTWAIWVIFLIMLVVYGIITAILLYHWRKFAYDQGTVNRAARIYLVVSLVLILVVLIAAVSYQP